MSNLAFTGSIFGDSDVALPLEGLLDSDSESESEPESNNRGESIPKKIRNKEVTIIENNQVFATFLVTNFIYSRTESKDQLLK
jgi:hypothetical protein